MKKNKMSATLSPLSSSSFLHIRSLVVTLSTVFYSAHGKGTQQPSNGILVDRLKEMLTVIQDPIFIVMDALDECPESGLPTARETVLNFVKDLVRLQLPNLHICATSRPEVDIQTMLKPLAVNAISLHDETRQNLLLPTTSAPLCRRMCA
jgi:hypothetical protein